MFITLASSSLTKMNTPDHKWSSTAIQRKVVHITMQLFNVFN